MGADAATASRRRRRRSAVAGRPAGPPRRIVLLGNPNVGKSALFNALTGLRATVSNYPGHDRRGVPRARWPAASAEVVDSPGLNSLLPLSEDEQVSWQLVRSVRDEQGSVVVQVADAKNLRRALLLTLQLGQLEVPTVLVLNMHDEAEARGIRARPAGLEAALGIPVRATVATRGPGLEGVTRRSLGARPPRNHLPLPEDVAGAGARPADRQRAGRPRRRLRSCSRATTRRCSAHADAIASRFATAGEPAGPGLLAPARAPRDPPRAGAGRCWPPCCSRSTSWSASSAPARSST